MEKGNEIVFAWAGKAEESQRITSELCWHSGSVSSALAVPTPGTAQREGAVPVPYPASGSVMMEVLFLDFASGLQTTARERRRPFLAATDFLGNKTRSLNPDKITSLELQVER